jgi:hypothetical protein
VPTLHQCGTDNPDDSGPCQIQQRPDPSGVVTLVGASLHQHPRVTWHVGSHRRTLIPHLAAIPDQFPVGGTVPQVDRPSNANFPVSITSSYDDAPPPPSSFRGTPIEMFPHGLTIPTDLHPPIGQSVVSSGSLSHAEQGVIMKTTMTGLQDMFRHQSLDIQKDRLYHRRMTEEFKSLLVPRSETHQVHRCPILARATSVVPVPRQAMQAQPIYLVPLGQ